MKSKYTILGLLFLFGFVWIAKNLDSRKKQKETENSVREACIYATNELFGKSIDSIAVCDCTTPAFYNLIKSDPENLETSYNIDFEAFDQIKSERYQALYQLCLVENIIDTNAKLVFSPKVKEQFKLKLRDTIISNFGKITDQNLDNLFDCLIGKIENKITVKQFLTSDFSENDSLLHLMRNCGDMPEN